MSGGVNKQYEAIGSIMKHQEVSRSFRCQEHPGSLRKHQEGDFFKAVFGHVLFEFLKKTKKTSK